MTDKYQMKFKTIEEVLDYHLRELWCNDCARESGDNPECLYAESCRTTDWIASQEFIKEIEKDIRTVIGSPGFSCS